MPIGSGEGLIEVYFDMVEETYEDENGKERKRKVKRQTRWGAYNTLDEGQALGEMAARTGSTLLPIIRSAWNGETIGQTNASAETKRKLSGGTYRMTAVVGFQITTAAMLMGDTGAGTPQRFYFASARDPLMPAVPPEWPGPLTWEPPVVLSAGKHAVEQEIDVHPTILAELHATQIAKHRGELNVSALDAHAGLGRLKFAALLGILNGRLTVTLDDWHLAGLAMAASDRLRDRIIGHLAALEAHKRRTSNEFAAERENVIDGSKEAKALASMARSMGNLAHRRHPETVSRRDLTWSVAGRDKQLASVDDAIARAVDNLWIEMDGDAYRAGRSRPA
jgi:hypothetical protein